MSNFLLTAILATAGVVGATTVIGAIGVASFVLTPGPLTYRFMITTLLCVTVFFEIAIWVSRGLKVFDDGTQVVTVLLTAFAVFGTLSAAYFGLQANSRIAYTAHRRIEKTNNIADWTRSESDTEAGGRIVRDEDGATLKNLADLHARGILTEEEFVNAKSRLMNP
jgi:hypothetical protein